MSFLNLLKGRKNKPKVDSKQKKEPPKEKKGKIKRKKKRDLNREPELVAENSEVVKDLKEKVSEEKSGGFKLGKKKMRGKDSHRNEAPPENVEIIDLNENDD